MNVFKELSKLNVNDKVEKKKNLTYLSWAWAWAKVKEKYPDATYNIWKDGEGNPYTFNETLGYMCYTTVCIEGETLEMWLPVMNGANKAMLSKPYKYSTKYGEKDVEAATMFDINKTIMRCLVKNLAMFGLGLYIYAGEDLPDVVVERQTLSDDKLKGCEDWTAEQKQAVIKKYKLTSEQLTKLK
tara:strand:- start:36 stop:590 length:555 start_codon:yes stop_codon:yes gene_type:complete